MRVQTPSYLFAGHLESLKRNVLSPGLIVCFAACAFVALWGSTSVGLLDNNEAVYAAVGREMVRTGNWIVPHLNGVPYLEKPPLLYWLVGLSIQIFGPHEWAVRLVPAIFFFATTAGVYIFTARSSGSPSALRASVILVTCTGFSLMHRTLLFDIPLTCFVTFCFLNLQQWLQTRREGSLWLFYLYLGLAVMAKGLVAVVIAGGVALVTTWRVHRSFRTVVELFNPTGIAVAVAIAAPWHIAASISEPGFAHFYFINEHVMRFLNRREPHDYHTGPWYFYLVRIPSYIGWWTVFLPFLFRTTARHRGGPRVIAWSSFLLPLVFFSGCGGKANYYLMVAIPGLVVCLAQNWPDYIDPVSSRLLRVGATISIMFCLLLFLGCAVPATRARIMPTMTQETLAIVQLTVDVLLVLSSVSVFAAFNDYADGVVWFTALMGIALFVPAQFLLRDCATKISQRDVARFLHRNRVERVAVYQEFEKFSSLAYYHDQPLAVVDSQSNDLLYGERSGVRPELFLTAAEFRRQSLSEQYWLVVDKQAIPRAEAIFCPCGFRIVASWPKLVLMTNR